MVARTISRDVPVRVAIKSLSLSLTASNYSVRCTCSTRYASITSSDLDVVVAGDLDAALEALADLADVLLEALERFQADGAVRPAGR